MGSRSGFPFGVTFAFGAMNGCLLKTSLGRTRQRLLQLGQLQMVIEQEELAAHQPAVSEGVHRDGGTLLDEVQEGRSHGCFIMSPHIERALARPERLSGVRSCRAGRR